ncbi:hypothetical protein B481_1307 [Planococcus halocryophilus Or1]|nr:hypothetical protein B481_1307 [Planococcus halocryophilus Or1]
METNQLLGLLGLLLGATGGLFELCGHGRKLQKTPDGTQVSL